MVIECRAAGSVGAELMLIILFVVCFKAEVYDRWW